MEIYRYITIYRCMTHLKLSPIVLILSVTIGDVAPNKSNPGRSTTGTLCRRCGEGAETLPHILGSCDFGTLLINSRHHAIRTRIAEECANAGLKVYQEQHCTLVGATNGRIDILAINETTRAGHILDPTVRFETHLSQPEDVDKEKSDYYTPAIPYFKEKYNLRSIDVTGLFVGARGTITNQFEDFRKRFNMPKSLSEDIALIAIKGSCQILHNHLYSRTNNSLQTS